MSSDNLPFTSAELLRVLELVLPSQTAAIIADDIAYQMKHGQLPPELGEDSAEPDDRPVSASSEFVADMSLFALIAEVFPERGVRVWAFLLRAHEREKSHRFHRERTLLAGECSQEVRAAAEAAMVRYDAAFARLWEGERERARAFLEGYDGGNAPSTH